MDSTMRFRLCNERQLGTVLDDMAGRLDVTPGSVIECHVPPPEPGFGIDLVGLIS